jgi:hypothetical protein
MTLNTLRLNAALIGRALHRPEARPTGSTVPALLIRI